MRKFFFATAVVALIPACSYNPSKSTVRTPAAFGIASHAPLYNEYHEFARDLVGTTPDAFTKAQPAITSEVTTLLTSSSPTQRLLADHDMKLAKKDGKGVDALECQLMDTYASTHAAEEKLVAFQHVFFDKKDKAGYEWLVSLVWPKKTDSPALTLTKVNFVRHMASYHDRLCAASKPCFVSFPEKGDAQPFSPLDEKALLDYKKTNLEKLAKDKSVTLPKVVACEKEVDRKTAAVTPATGAEYDWNKFGFTGHGDELKEGEFVVTYDDGPHEVYTPEIAQMWEDSGLGKPMFFWLARNFSTTSDSGKRNIELGKQIRDAGFEIGCHSRNHANLDLLSRAVSIDKLGKNNSTTFAAELKTPPKDFTAWRLGKLNDELYNATTEIYTKLELDVPGKPLDRLFRLPGGVGVRQPEVGKALAKTNARHYHWSIDSLDFNDKSPQSIVDRVEKLMELKKKGIILFHDIHPQSVAASKILIEKWKRNPNIKFVKLPRFKPGYQY